MNPIEIRGRKRWIADTILKRVLCLFLVIPFCESSGLSILLPFSWNYFVLFDGSILLICAFLIRKGFKCYFVLGTFYITILISTIVNSGDVFIAICYAAKVICFMILINLYAQQHELSLLISTFKFVLGIEILVTLFFQVFDQDIFGFTPSHNHINFLTADNDLGYWYIPFTLIVYLSDMQKSRKYQMIDLLFWTVICFTSLVFAWSATCLSVYTLFVVCIFFFHKMRIFRLLTPFRSLLINAGISVLVIFFQLQNSFSWLIENVLHKDLTLSGRTLIWASTIQNILKKPLLGYGTTQGGRVNINRIAGGVYYFSHNIFLEIIIQGGMIALLFYFIMYYFAGKELKHFPKTDMMVYINLALFFVLLMQFTEFALYEPFANLPLILCFFYEGLIYYGSSKGFHLNLKLKL